MFLIEFKYQIGVQHERDSSPDWKETRYVYGLYGTVIDGHRDFHQANPDIVTWETNVVVNFGDPQRLATQSKLTEPISQPLVFPPER